MTWWVTLNDSDLFKVCNPHGQHDLACKPSNSEKRSVREEFLKYVDENSQPTGRHTASCRAHYYFSPKFTRTGQPKSSEKCPNLKASHSLLCEFNRSQGYQGQEGCSECSAFWWLKDDRPKHAASLHQTDYCDGCRVQPRDIYIYIYIYILAEDNTALKLRHNGDCPDNRLLEHETS